MDLQQIKELVTLINQTDISELTFKQDGVKLAIRKSGAAGAGPREAEVEADTEDEINPVMLETVPAAAVESAAAAENEGTVVNSPMVGTFYSSPAPDAPPFVKVGSRVEKGQTVCIIEAMKLMNEIEAEVAGTVIKIMVENAQPVEFNQPLLVIKEN